MVERVTINDSGIHVAIPRKNLSKHDLYGMRRGNFESANKGKNFLLFFFEKLNAENTVWYIIMSKVLA